jgi:predicted membrane metal-binding protein
LGIRIATSNPSGYEIPTRYFICGLALGFLWALGHAYLKLYPALDKSLEGIDLEVTGQIVSIPSIQGRSTRFDFLIHEASYAVPYILFVFAMLGGLISVFI